MQNDKTSNRPDQRHLSDLGIKTLGQLLRTCGTPEGRARVAGATGVSEDSLRRMLAITTPRAELPETERLSQRLEAAGLSVVKNPLQGPG